MGDQPSFYLDRERKNMSNPLVLYHASCPDGFCAAWVASKSLKDAEFVPVQYGDTPPDVTGREVYILDFSFKRPVMIELSQKAKKLVVLDHHKSAAEELVNLSAGSNEGLIRFDMDKSGGRMTWEYFNPSNHPRPWLVDYTEDRDLWLFKLPNSKAISAFIRSWPYDFKLWDEWASYGAYGPYSNHIHAGAAILRYQQTVVDGAVKNAVEMEMDSHKVLSVNATTLISEIGEKLSENRPFSATYFIDGKGNKIWSLRSREDGEDVSKIAKKHGGGGHKHAAGFVENKGTF